MVYACVLQLCCESGLSRAFSVFLSAPLLESSERCLFLGEVARILQSSQLRSSVG